VILPAVTHLDVIYEAISNHQGNSAAGEELVVALSRLFYMARLQDEALPLALLPIWSYQAAGGPDWRQVIKVAAAWRSLHLAGKILHDAGTQTSSYLLPNESAGGLLNVGTHLIFLSQAILVESAHDLPAAVTISLQMAFAHAGLQASAGQHSRLKQRTALSLAEYKTVVEKRSGYPFALATRAGAITAKAGAVCIQALAEYGYHLGLMVQLADDFNGVWRPTGASDLAAGKWSWPLFYAQTAASPGEWSRLLALTARAARDPEAEAEARTLLAELDVPLALVAAAETHRCQAETALAVLDDSTGRRALAQLARRLSLAPDTA
jgi:hypothetical protein